MTEPAIEVEGLSLSIRGSALLREVSFRVDRCDTWSVLGPNGAGKSTLLRCLMRIHAGWTGQVRLFGRPLGEYSQRELARRVAYVPQPGGDQRFPYTVREFVRMGRYAYSGLFGAAHPEDGKAIDAAMDQANVAMFADRTLDTLSGGERQKVFIAAALAQGGDLLLLDEPTAFLDYKHQAEVSRILQSINQQSGTTIVTVTHDVNVAILSGGHALALRDATVAWKGPAAGLMSEDLLSRIFDATFRFIDDPGTGLRLVAPQGAQE